MRSQNNKQISLGFDALEDDTRDGVDTSHQEAVDSSIDFSFSDRLAIREFAYERKIYAGILDLVSDRYPERE